MRRRPSRTWIRRWRWFQRCTVALVRRHSPARLLASRARAGETARFIVVRRPVSCRSPRARRDLARERPAGAGESRRAHAIIARARTLRASRVARDGARARARGGRSARRCARGSFFCEAPWSAVDGERGAESRVLRRRRRARGAPDGVVCVARDCECVVDRVRPERARGFIL